MSLLEDIQTSIVDADSDLGTILRKCKLLAARLDSKELDNWLIWESNGYPDDIQVPDYRIWPLEVKGHFFGPFGSGIKNAPIPSVCLPKKIRESYRRYECRASIVSVEDTLVKMNPGSVQVSTGDLAIALGTNVYENQNCAQAWAEFSTLNLVELQNTVRNRILDFALAIWKENPTAGDAPPNSPIEPSKVTQIFNTTIYGGTANLVGSAHNSSIIINNIQNNFETLKTLLCDNGIQEEDITDLFEALENDDKPETKDKLGPKVSSWIAKMMQKAADGSWGVGIGAAGSLLAQAISKYYGF